MSGERCAEYVEKWWANGSPLKSGGESPSTIGFDRKGNYNLGNGGLFMELKLVKFFMISGVVVLNLSGPLDGGFFREG